MVEHWESIKPAEGSESATPLFVWVCKNWECRKRRNATLGTVHATLTRVEKEFGFAANLKVHSPRSRFATLAEKLLYTREDREKLGYWDPGSLMPDRYDRATCATELRPRGEILQRIRWDFIPPALSKFRTKTPRHRVATIRPSLPLLL